MYVCGGIWPSLTHLIAMGFMYIVFVVMDGDGGGYRDGRDVFLRAPLVIACCCCTRLAETGGHGGTLKAGMALRALV